MELFTKQKLIIERVGNMDNVYRLYRTNKCLKEEKKVLKYFKEKRWINETKCWGITVRCCEVHSYFVLNCVDFFCLAKSEDDENK